MKRASLHKKGIDYLSIRFLTASGNVLESCYSVVVLVVCRFYLEWQILKKLPFASNENRPSFGWKFSEEISKKIGRKSF